MSVNSKQVFIGAPDQAVTGAILTGPETDAIPATIDDFDFDGLEDSGYVNEDGVTITPTESTESIKDWALKVIRKVLSEFEGTLNWTHLELSVGALKTYMGDDNVEVTDATNLHGTQIRSAIAGEQRPIKGWYFKIKDGQRRVVVFVPHGQITERGEIPLNASGAVTLPVTLSTYPDAAGKNIYIYTDDGVVSAVLTKTGWSVTVEGTPTGGTFVLNVNGTPTAPIAHNAATAAVQSALNGISGVTGISGITVSGSAGGPYTVTFPTGALLTADGAGLTGGSSPTVTVE